MLKFKTVTLADKAWVDEIVFSENSPSADYNFGNIYIWDKHFRQLICPFEGRMLTKLRYEGHPSFVFPIGTGPLRPAVEALRAFAAERGYPFRMHGITECHKQQLEEEFPGCFDFTEDSDFADYIYSADKLATYSGKALHGKKNPRVGIGFNGASGALIDLGDENFVGVLMPWRPAAVTAPQTPPGWWADSLRIATDPVADLV